MADQTFAVGPFAGVRYTSEPYDEAPDLLHQMVNGYVPDPVGRSAAYSRPGFRPFGGIDAPVTATGTTGTFYTHTGTDGTAYNFVAMDGALYRDAGNGTLTDVTPANLFVPTNATCHFVSLTDTLIFSNGETTPMALTSLGSTPVVATPIPFADAINLFVVSPDNAARIATISFPYNIQGTNYAKTGATPIGGTALPAGTIPSGQFGAFIATMGTTPGNDPTITAIGDTYTTGYASNAAAQAAIAAYVAANPIPDTLYYVGSFVVEASGGNFVAGTTVLTGRLTGYAGDPPPWTAYGPPVIYAGSVFWILDELPEFTPPNIYTVISGRTSIAWSEPNLPLEGYRQTDYDNVWELTQTASDPLFALAATNDALYYSRRYGWGGLAGAPNINFQNTATQDIVSGNIGCVAPRTVNVFLNYVYFLDANGRPYRFAVGGQPEPLWLQLRAWYDDFNRLITADAVESGAWAVVEPNVNVVLFRVPRSGTVETDDPLHVLDALSGIYMGTWEPTNGYEGRILDAGLWTNADGERQVATLLYTTNDSIDAYTVALLATPQEAAADNAWTDWYGSPIARQVTGGVDTSGTTQGTMTVSGTGYGAGQSLTLTASQSQFTPNGIQAWTAGSESGMSTDYFDTPIEANGVLFALRGYNYIAPVVQGVNDIATSTDGGATWTTRSTGASNGERWLNVAWLPFANLYAIVGISSGTQGIATSPTGATWTMRTAGNGLYHGLAANATRAVGLDQFGTDAVVITTNGTTWTDTATSGGPAGGWGGVLIYATTPALFIAVGYDGAGDTAIYSSPDGVTWTVRYTFTGTTPLVSLVWDATLGKVVGVTDDGRYLTSTNGTSYTVASFTGPVSGFSAVSLATAGGYLIATDGTTALINSSNGTTWAVSTGSLVNTGVSALTFAPTASRFYSGGSLGNNPTGFYDTAIYNATGSIGRVFRVFVPNTNQSVDYTVTAVASGTSCTVTGDANTPTGLQNVPSGTWTLFADPIGLGLPLTLVTPWMGYSLKDRTQVTELRALTDGSPSRTNTYTAQGLTLAVDTSQTGSTANPIGPLNTRAGNPARYVMPTTTQTFGRGGMVTLTAYAGESQVLVYRVECDVNFATATVRDR